MIDLEAKTRACEANLFLSPSLFSSKTLPLKWLLCREGKTGQHICSPLDLFFFLFTFSLVEGAYTCPQGERLFSFDPVNNKQNKKIKVYGILDWHVCRGNVADSRTDKNTGLNSGQLLFS